MKEHKNHYLGTRYTQTTTGILLRETRETKRNGLLVKLHECDGGMESL